MRLTAALVIVGCAYATAPQDPRATLPELVRRFAPQPVYQSRALELVLQPIDQVLPSAQLIVHGKVETASTYLSDDQRDLFTDYVIRPLRVIRPVAPSTSLKPGAPDGLRELVVKQWGGTMVIDGVQVTQVDSHLKMFEPGEEVVLLLAYRNADKKYVLPDPASGAFRVTPAKGMQPILKDAAQHGEFAQVRGQSVAQFEALVQRLTR